MFQLLVRHKFLMAALVASLALVLPVAAFAQTSTPVATLAIDTGAMTNGLFTGANIIIAALGAIMFLLAGFKLGGVLIRGIVDAIGSIRF